MKTVLASIALCLLAPMALAQAYLADTSRLRFQLDSADQQIQKHPNDSIAVKTLLWLNELTEGTDSEKSLGYLRDALQRSQKNKLTPYTITVYHKLGTWHHKRGQYDSSLYFHRKGLALTRENTWPRSSAYQGISVNLLWLSDYDSARLYLQWAKAIAEKKRDYADLAGIYNSLGNILLQQGSHVEALKQYILSAKIQDSLLHDPQGQSRALANIGNVQYLIGDFDKSLAYAKEAQAISLKHNLPKTVAFVSQLMGRIYRKQKKFDDALVEYNQALSMFKKLGLTREVSETYSNIGNIYFDKGDFKNAREQYEHVIRLTKKSSNLQLLGRVYAAMGFTFYELRQYQTAIAYLDSAQTIAKKVQDSYTLLDSYNVLAEIYQNQGRYKESLLSFQKFTTLKDSLGEVESRSEIQELELKYQDEKKSSEIELLRSNQQVQALTVSRQRVLLASIGIALMAITVIGFLLINRYRVMNRIKRQLELEKMRQTIARDLHDDMGSALSSINIISQLALTEPAQAGKHIKNINYQASQMMETISDIVWSINPKNDTAEQTAIKIKEFAAELLESRNIAHRVTWPEAMAHITLDTEKRKNLFLIAKEAINNTAKYSGASQMDISLEALGGAITLTLSDNGKGFDRAQARPGNGLRNMEERARGMGGTFELTTAPGGGSQLNVTIPIT